MMFFEYIHFFGNSKVAMMQREMATEDTSLFFVISQQQRDQFPTYSSSSLKLKVNYT